MRKLHIMSGCPASGKSTYCKARAKENGDIVVHRDIVRQHLRDLLGSEDYFPCSTDEEYKFYIANIRAAANGSDKDIWIDQTTLSNGAAKKLLYALDEAFDLNKFEIIFEIMRTPIHVCLDRNAKRDELTKVPNEIMVSMARGFNISFTGLLDILPDNHWNIGIKYIDLENEYK